MKLICTVVPTVYINLSPDLDPPAAITCDTILDAAVGIVHFQSTLKIDVPLLHVNHCATTCARIHHHLACRRTTLTTKMSKKGVLLRDPVSDLFARIRNGYLAQRATIEQPHSRQTEGVVNAFIRAGYLRSVRIVPPPSPRHAQFNRMEIVLKYDEEGNAAVRRLRRVSRPSRRIYRQIARVPLASAGLGSWIMSTPAGILHCAEAREKCVGGEILGEVF